VVAKAHKLKKEGGSKAQGAPKKETKHKEAKKGK